MTSFNLAGLEPTLQEKIISKLDNKSYFRMRQTCREMDEFIRRNKNICTHIDSGYSLQFEFDNKISGQLRIHSLNFKDAEACYGTRLQWLHLPEEGFDQLCDFLKKYRITCHELLMSESYFTRDECQILLNILKPVSITLSSEGSDRYEAVLKSKTLKEVEIFLNHNDVRSVVPRLCSKFSDVNIIVCDKAAHYDMIHTILQILYHQPPPNLVKFHLYVTGKPAVDFNTMENRFREFYLTVQRRYDDEPRVWVNLPNGFVCRFEICGSNMDIYYDEEGYAESDNYFFEYCYDSDYADDNDLIYYPPSD